MMNLKVIYIICIILSVFYVLSELYRLIREGKFIVKTQKNIVFIETMLALGISIFYGISVVFDIVSYLNNSGINSKEFFQHMIMLQFGPFMLLQTRRYSGIKESGISIQDGKKTYFYNWNEIKGYKWIDEDKFQFEVLQKNKPSIYKTIEIGVHEQMKIDEVLQRYILKS